jgi:FkbM family methyltransferase
MVSARIWERLAKVRLLGVRGTVAYWVGRHRRGHETFTLWTRSAQYPLRCRANTSDIDVFQQIFVLREYACLDDVENATLIVDCGANVGYSAAYFLSRFPRAELIAIEPDPRNFDVLVENLKPYASRVKAVRAGVWSHRTTLAIVETPYRDGREWATQTRPARPGEDASFDSVDIASVIGESGHDRISILKIDIEGAEAVVFRENYESWLGLVDNIVIELHDDSAFGVASAVFENAISGHGFVVFRSGELTVARAG